MLQHQAPYAHEIEGSQEKEIDSIVNRFEIGDKISSQEQDPVIIKSCFSSTRPRMSDS